MEENNRKKAGIVVVQDENNKQPFKCIMYSNHFEPLHTMEREITNDQDIITIVGILKDHDFTTEVIYKDLTPADFEIKKAEITEELKQIVEAKEHETKETDEIESAVDRKLSKVEKNVGIHNLKLFGAMAVAVGTIIIASLALNKKAPSTAVPPTLTNPSVTSTFEPTVAPTATPLPGKTVDERITAMQEQYAKEELYYDITNPDEVEKRVNILISYFEKMQKGSITKAEATDFYLLLNGIAPSEGVDIDELMRKVQLAAAYDPSFDWREKAGEEIVANKRDSAYLDIYLRAINDWKSAAESRDMKQVSSMGKELVATSYYGMIIKQPLETQVKEVGKVKFQNVSSEMQAFITGYVGMTINYPGYDIKEAIGSVTIQGDSINVNAIAEPIAGPHVIPAGEKGSTDKGGEQGFAQSTMTMIVTKYNNGEYPECPEEIKAMLDTLSKQSVKTLK